jgi:DNA-binding transcriptional regulator GbsR (MarR family)
MTGYQRARLEADLQTLRKAAEQFILHWGEMSSRWGINRSMAQMHALLYLSDRPLNAEEIAATLSLARSNVSSNLRELRAWGVVRVVHLMGDRRDHYQAIHDAWDMLMTILEQKKRREIDPTMLMLRSCIEADRGSQVQSDHTRQRMAELLELLEAVTAWYEQMISLPKTAQKAILNLGGKLQMIEGLAKRESGRRDKQEPTGKKRA